MYFSIDITLILQFVINVGLEMKDPATFSLIFKMSSFFNVLQNTKQKSGKPKKIETSYTIECSTPVDDEIMDVGALVSA